MVLDKLSDSLKNTLKKIAGSMFVDERLVNELVKDIQRALLQADVNVQLVFSLTKKIKERALKEDAPAGLSKREFLINIVYEELVAFLGGEPARIQPDRKPYIIMLVGLFGSGKTTTSGKLAKFFTKRGKKVALLGLDVHRPAAMDQIKQVGDALGVPVFIDKTGKDPSAIYDHHKETLKGFDVVIVDTAGRDALSEDLITEIRDLTELIRPHQRFLVISADIGQAAQTQAEEFHRSCQITGVIATKMDGTAKAGGALTACAATDTHIIFLGTGEKPDDLEEFNPKGFVSRLLGMGDLELLLEKAKDAMEGQDTELLSKKLMKGEFSLSDLYEQMAAMRKMGPLNKIMEMVPGFGQIKLPKEALRVQEGKLDTWKILMDSMTVEEKEHPDIITVDRIDRIAKGSGKKASDIRELLKQYRQSKKMIKMLKPGKAKNMEGMLRKMKGFSGMKLK
ncbi:MAG: signal recognition particle protein [DPANN group archaeon]|nr:signal recognition particle protein [DPANN group archaeon]